MNFDFSEEQEQLRDQARRLLANGVGLARAALVSGNAAPLWQQMVDLGWTAAAIPEAHGGLGLGPLELCVLAEEIGRTLAPVPFSSSVLYATEALKLCLPGAAAADLLPLLAGGEVSATVAFTDAAAAHWSDAPAAQVQRTVTGDVLSASKTAVADGVSADYAVVSARSAEDGAGFGWWLVDLRGAGVQRHSMTAIDCVRPHSVLEFDAAPAQRLGSPGQGGMLADQLLNLSAVFDAFEQLGGAETMLAMTLEYVKTRLAFGRPVGGYQAVKHRLADMYVKIQLARSHAYYGAWAVLHGVDELDLCAAGARIAAIDAFSFVAEEAIELHGGIGFTWESDCQLFYRRARLLAITLGGRAVWAQRLAHALQRKAAAASTPSLKAAHGL